MGIALTGLLTRAGAAGLAAFLLVPTAAAAPPASALFRITDSRITEASGIASGIASPGVVYVQNDSGDSARFFALDARTGATLATYTVPGASNVDWEDIAVALDWRAVPSVWLADIGDNDAKRDEVRVYRVDEPHVDKSHPGVEATTGPPEVWRLRYPDGPRDAESLAVAPGGAAYVFSKSIFGATRVYALPPRADPSRVQVLRHVGDIEFRFTGTPGGPNALGQLTATGAALSRDGTVLAVRTYTDAYIWRVRARNVAAALRTKPVRVALPAQPRGEGIAVDGTRLLIDSEGSDSQVFAVSLPRLPPPATASPTPSPTRSPTPSGTPSAKASGTPSGTSGSGSTSNDGSLSTGGAILLAIVAVALIVWSVRSSRRH